jgi:thiosulfate dehydrogenase
MTALAVVAAAAAAIWLALPADPPPAAPPATATAQPVEWPNRAPDPATIPEGPLGDAIRRGQQLVTHTRDELPEHVGADLNCTSCHLKGGTVPDAGPWVGLPGEFPEYRARNDKVVTLEGRVNDCFERSMNGEPLDPAGQDMTAIVAYMTWLSKDVPVGVPVEGRGFAKIADPPQADPERGEALYAQKCAACHGAGGQGLDGPDGSYLYPPLWGDRTFNIGAGMARLDTAAAFVHDNMPLGQGGTLTEQEAYDVAAYFTTQPRPDFAGKAQDWPKGNKPRDARY